MRNLTQREGSRKLKLFWEQKVYVIKEVKDPDGLVYTVREQDKPNNKSRTLHRNNIMSCHNLPQKDTASPRKNFKLTNSGNKTEESKLSSDEEKSSSSDEESEIIDHIRNLKYRGIGPGKVRSRR